MTTPYVHTFKCGHITYRNWRNETTAQQMQANYFAQRLCINCTLEDKSPYSSSSPAQVDRRTLPKYGVPEEE